MKSIIYPKLAYIIRDLILYFFSKMLPVNTYSTLNTLSLFISLISPLCSPYASL